MDIVFRHGVTYSNRLDVPVSEVVASLLANEKLARDAIAVLEQCLPGIEIQRVSVRVEHVSNGSPLREVLAVATVLVYQKDLEKEIPPLIEHLLGVHVPDQYDTVVTVLTMIIAIYGASALFRRIFPEKKPERLDEAYEAHIHVAGDYLNIPPEAVREAVEATARTRGLAGVMKAARDFFRPAKLEPGIEVEGEGGHLINRETVAEFPSDVDLEEEETDSQYPLQDVIIDIHSSDRDYTGRGWAAVVESVSPNRLRMNLYPTIDPESLYGRRQIRGDILVITKKDPSGEFVPRSIHLIKVLDQPGD